MRCGSGSSRCCHRHRPGPAAGSRAASRTATAWPRSSSWPAPPPLGACCRPRSWAAARPPPAGGGWTSGPRPGCSTSSSDPTMFEAVVDDIPPIRLPSGRRRRRPGKVHADKVYDHRRCRAYLRRRGIRPRIARHMIESSGRLGRHRSTTERTGAWLGGFRRLRIRYERSSERFYALVLLVCVVICYQALQQPPWWALPTPPPGQATMRRQGFTRTSRAVGSAAAPNLRTTAAGRAGKSRSGPSMAANSASAWGPYAYSTTRPPRTRSRRTPRPQPHRWQQQGVARAGESARAPGPSRSPHRPAGTSQTPHAQPSMHPSAALQ
jgi:hypothetical protein